MIEITPEIIGPGIEEEYADAMEEIGKLREALGPRPLTNDTPDGRLLLELAWVEQEIKARRLPIPVHRSRIGTICYLVGSGELNHIDGLRIPLGRLVNILDGTGLLKPRHIPVVIADIDDLFFDAKRVWNELELEDRDKIEFLHNLSNILKRGEWPKWIPPQELPICSDEADKLIPNLPGRQFEIEAAIYSYWRPSAARKPPLSAPVPGLPEEAPPLPPELEGRLP